MAGLYSDSPRQNILENSEKRSRMCRCLDEKGDEKGVEGTERRQIRFPVEQFLEITFYFLLSTLVQKGLKIKDDI